MTETEQVTHNLDTRLSKLEGIVQEMSNNMQQGFNRSVTIMLSIFGIQVMIMLAGFGFIINRLMK